MSATSKALTKIKSATLESSEIEVLPNPNKTEKDLAHYKVIKLKNGLVCCLASTSDPPESENEVKPENKSTAIKPAKSDVLTGKTLGAALSVKAGSFHEPKEVDGLAHFVEHMVFMGSKKYPGENDFSQKIAVEGDTNAATNKFKTTYYFTCDERDYPSALDMFAQFFTAPLMTKDSISRERESVESEFRLREMDDQTRVEQLIRSFTKKSSTVNKFAIGNLKTLKDNISEDDLYKHSHDFVKKYYTADKMKLVVYGELPIDEMQELVIKSFSDIPTPTITPEKLMDYNDGIFDTPEFKKIYYLDPVKEIKEIWFTWPMPSQKDNYRTSAIDYVLAALGGQQKGTLLWYFKKRFWATGTESFQDDTYLYNTIHMKFDLTDEGLKHIDDIILAVYSYIKLLKSDGIKKEIFEDLKTLAHIDYVYSDAPNLNDFLTRLANNMQDYPPEHFLSGEKNFYEYSPESIKTILDYLNPDNVNIIVCTDFLPEGLQFNSTEKWFGSKYVGQDFPQTLKEKLKTIQPYPEFKIMSQNPYIATDFSVIVEEENEPVYPKKILDNDLVELWFKRDKRFGLPLAYFNFYLLSPKALESIESSCMQALLSQFLMYEMNEDLYPATKAGSKCECKSELLGLEIKISGYNEKLHLVVDLVAKHIKSLKDKLNEDIFENIKFSLSTTYKALLEPMKMAPYIEKEIMMKNSPVSITAFKCVHEMKIEHFRKFLDDYFKKLHLRVLIQGNLSQEVAESTVNSFIQTLNYQALEKELYPKPQMFEPPKGEHCFRIKNFNPEDSNSVISNYYYSIPYSPKDELIISTIMKIMSEPLFDQLRTKEQLGYSVEAGLFNENHILGYQVMISGQATKFTTKHFDDRIEAFIKQYNEKIEATKDETFDKTIKSVSADSSSLMAQSLSSEFDANWEEIRKETFMFDRAAKHLEITPTLKSRDLKEWWKKHNIVGDNKEFRKLSIQIVGTDTTQAADPNNNAVSTTQANTPSEITDFLYLGTEEERVKENRSQDYFITDIKEFQKNLTLLKP